MDHLTIDFDVLKRDHWSAQEQTNAQLVIDFVQQLMNNHDFEYIQKKYGDHPYVQHNRTMKNGMAGVVATVEELSKRYPAYTYDVKHIYADSDTVLFHSHATLKIKNRGNDKWGFNIMDTWRIKEGKIVEHWDAIQPLNPFMRFYYWLVGGNIQNANGVF